MDRWAWEIVSYPLRQSGREGRSMEGRICEREMSWVWNERVTEWWMVRVVIMNEMRWHVKEVNQEETGEDWADEMNPRKLIPKTRWCVTEGTKSSARDVQPMYKVTQGREDVCKYHKLPNISKTRAHGYTITAQCSTVVRNNVVRATIKVNGKHPILGTSRPQTLWPIDLKFDVGDYVGGMNPHAKNCENRPRRAAPA